MQLNSHVSSVSPLAQLGCIMVLCTTFITPLITHKRAKENSCAFCVLNQNKFTLYEQSYRVCLLGCINVNIYLTTDPSYRKICIKYSYSFVNDQLKFSYG